MSDEPTLTGRPCPICGKPATRSDAPFCSARCAEVDLHRWMAGVYVMPSGPFDEEEEEAMPPPSGADAA